MQAAPECEGPLALPPLRQDLRLLEGAPTVHGLKTWLVHDLARHRFFTLPGDAIDLLVHWDAGTFDVLCEQVLADAGRDVGREEVTELIHFFHANNLTQNSADGSYRSYVQQVEASKRNPLMHVVHSYLFVRVPLVRPHRFLRATLPVVRPLLTASAGQLVAILSLIGLYFVSREWDAFTATFLHFFSWEGAIFYAVALMIVKAFHELGHAYMAERFGVRVSTMGVAFLVMLPLLYTDVTDAWKLSSRRQRLLIDGAGILVELGLAGLATLLWVFLPEGTLKSLAFVLATTSWILSLAVNLNPFMRFDGYYLLADGLGIANLQERSFALGRWWMREVLFGLGFPPPERLGRRRMAWLIAYAFGVWVYRLVLFIGIALLVYHYFFKLLGVTLFVIEIAWFIALPVMREVTVWWQMRERIMSSFRIVVTGAFVGVFGIVFFIPWKHNVVLPAVLVAAGEVEVFSPNAGQVVEVRGHNRMRVSQGDVLIRLRSDELEQAVLQSTGRIRLLNKRIARRAADARERADGDVLAKELAAEQSRLAGLHRDMDRFVVRAPIDGQIRNFPNGLHPGRWLSKNFSVGYVVARGQSRATAFVAEEDLWRLGSDAEGRFIADDASRASVAVRVEDVASAGVDVFDVTYLASRYGGAVAVDATDDGTLRPRQGQYRVRFRTGALHADQVVRGVIHLNGARASLASRIGRRVMRVLVRESGA